MASTVACTRTDAARLLLPALLLALLVPSLGACGAGEEPVREAEVANGLTEFQLRHGIGPFTEEVRLGPPDPELAEKGRDEYHLKCVACHRIDERLVGPPLGDVLERRTPTFVANMIMNPEQMAREHPVVRELLLQYPVIMPYQNVTEEDAKAIIEYLRTYHDED